MYVAAYFSRSKNFFAQKVLGVKNSVLGKNATLDPPRSPGSQEYLKAQAKKKFPFFAIFVAIFFSIQNCLVFSKTGIQS